MRNILSYKTGTKFKGFEIKEWIKFHSENKTSHTKDALKMLKYLSISDDDYYYIRKGNYQASERYYCVVKYDDR